MKSRLKPFSHLCSFASSTALLTLDWLFSLCHGQNLSPKEAETYQVLVQKPLHTLDGGHCTSHYPSNWDVLLMLMSIARAVPQLQYFHERSNNSVISLAHWTSGTERDLMQLPSSSSVHMPVHAMILKNCLCQSCLGQKLHSDIFPTSQRWILNNQNIYAFAVLTLRKFCLWLCSCYCGFFSLSCKFSSF